MNQFPSLLMMFANRWGRSLAGFTVASAIIWYLFPAFPALQAPAVRVAAILVVLAFCLGVTGALAWRKQRREGALAKAMTGMGGRDAKEDQAEAADEVARLRERMKQVLTRLRKRGRHVYEQPWFVLIGPPGAGKTTALLNAGLHFPLAQEAEDPAVGGVGGTRLCDWWFADEAVLIDTAGRYTTQDSDAAVDRAGWQGFLDILRRTRPRQPINGIVVVLSLLDLVDAAPAERAAQARAVRQRIDEVTERLKLRVPVYLMLSKCDQLRGFDAYFDDLDAIGRSQVWGMTFPLDASVDAFVPEFRLLLGRLEERLVERLQAERAAERRALIGNFRLQVASLEQPLDELLRTAFTGTRLDPAPLLRGVYLTSATQQGTPIDRMTGLLAQSFGLDQRSLPSLRPVHGRSYFIERLLRDVVLGEAMLVARRPGVMRRRRVLRAAGFSAIGLATAMGGLLLWRAEIANRIAIENADGRLAAFRQSLDGIRLDPVNDDDLAKLAPLLDAASAIAPGAPGQPSFGPMPLGLSQGAKLTQSSRLVYAHALQHMLLPRLLWRLEQQMHARFDDPGFLYEATRVYLMLGGAGPLDAGVIRTWMAADWAARYPGDLNAGLRERLRRHLDALLAAPLPPVTLDGALVEAARATFSRVTLAERVYSRLRAEPAVTAVADWRPADAVGAIGARLFARPSGRKLTEGVPGLFTAAGYDALLQVLPATTRRVAEESWVLGHAQQIPTDGPPVAALEEAVLGLYVADTEKHWDALLNDLALAPLAGRDATVQALYVLSSPQSPIRDLLGGIAAALRFRPPPAPDGQPGKIASLFASTAQAATTQAAATGAETAPAVTALQAHYRPLLDLVGSSPTAPPLDNVLRQINALQQQLAMVGPGTTTLPPAPQGGDPVQVLLAEADRQPQPLSRWLRQIAASGNNQLGVAVRQAASTSFSGHDGPAELCEQVVDQHFPFDPASPQDASLNDFVKLFAPGGTLDTYFQSQISPFVDTRGAVWKAHAVGGIPAPVDRASLAGFQRAAAIRDALFTAGQLQVRFTLTPDLDSDKGILRLGSAALRTDGGTPMAFTWPGSDGMLDVSLGPDSKDGPNRTNPKAAKPSQSIDAGAADLHETGPWALFRLLTEAHATPANPGEQLHFQDGALRFGFALQADPSQASFYRGLLQGFHCPVIR